MKRRLAEVLREALDHQMLGWIYLPDDHELNPQTYCFVVNGESDLETDARGIPVEATRRGFPREGLDGPTISDTARCARQFEETPSDELLVQSFAYYLRFDAFLPRPGAPAPPPLSKTQRAMDREFYVALGQERAHHPCKRARCSRGAIEHAVLCRPHHFENVHGRQCPFDD